MENLDTRYLYAYTNNVNKGITIKFKPEYVSIIPSISSIFLYLKFL
jgi:hypothetical protein